MSKQVLTVLFSYSWYLDKKEANCPIRMYALDSDNKSVCVRIENFQPYIYLELPRDIEWSPLMAQMVGDKVDEVLGRHKCPLKKTFCEREPLYGATLDKHGKRKKVCYLQCFFANERIIKSIGWFNRKEIMVPSLGKMKLKIHESDADPVLQLTCVRDLPTSGWIVVKGNRVPNTDKLTFCEKEYVASFESLWPYNESLGLTKVPRCVSSGLVALPLILSFDIEAYSNNPGAMPDATNSGDKIFQISCILAREGEEQSKFAKTLLSLGDPDQHTTGDDVEIRRFETESDLLVGFRDFVVEKNPNVLVGYNILTFDIPYMMARAKGHAMCYGEFDKLGFHKTAHSDQRVIKWSSSAFKNQEFEFLDAEGRLVVDLLPLIRRDYKFNSYSLKAVSQELLKESKMDLNAKGIFKCYRIGIKKNKGGEYGPKARKAMGIVGKYCIMDSVLPLLLMEKMQTWVGLTEMAKTYGCQMFTLYTSGMQIKVYSTIYRYCLQQGIVVEKDAYTTKAGERYTGAHVFDPEQGLHDKVVCCDFASLYPCTIIAYNLDYSTFVTDSSIPDSQCHVMEWDDHVSCEHDPKIIRRKELTDYINTEKEELKKLREKKTKTKDKAEKVLLTEEVSRRVKELKPYEAERQAITKTVVTHVVCGHRKYRFLKNLKGVLPTILETLLNARKNTRKQMKEIKCSNPSCKDVAWYGEPGKKATCCVSHKLPGYEAKLLTLEEVRDLRLLYSVLDKRQLSYKVACNSAYGVTGVQRGMLPMMPIAMCTTYMGRKNILITAETAQREFSAKLVYGDSVTADTPVLCRIDGRVLYRTISDLPHKDWQSYRGEKEDAVPLQNLEVWTEKGFTKVKNIIRHKTDKDIYRVLTHTGVVDVTEDHGLLNENAEKISPKDVVVGSKLLTSDLPDPLHTETDLSLDEDIAFVMGLFYADGSCGDYACKSGDKCSWAINNTNLDLLDKCISTLNKHRTTKHLTFTIYDTLKSSGVYKVCPVGKGIKTLVTQWREWFYDANRHKKVPDQILGGSTAIRESFLRGYYTGDGDKDANGYYRFDNKGKIGSAGLYLLASSIGYNVSINTRADKLDIYRMTCTNKTQRKPANVVKKIQLIGKTSNYVYDLETENHHFSAGVGKLIVHNTDSIMVKFPHLKTASEVWDHSVKVAKALSALFPPPMKLEFEDAIYDKYFILTKKRYMMTVSDRDGKVQMKDSHTPKISKKGVLLARRDNAPVVRRIYEMLIVAIFQEVSMEEVIYMLLEQLNKICSAAYPSKDFVITQAVGSVNNMFAEHFTDPKGKLKVKFGNYQVPALPEDPEKREKELLHKGAVDDMDYYEKWLPAVVQLAQKMRRRGQRVDNGTRLEYVVYNNGVRGDKKYNKIEEIEYFQSHANVLRIDYLYYIEALVKPVDQLLKCWGLKTELVKEQYRFRYNVRAKCLAQLKSLFSGKCVIKD